MKLTTKMVENLAIKEKRYFVSDEKGLGLEVMPSGKKIWRFRYWKENKEYRMLIGSFLEISLVEARKKRDELREQIAKGSNPAEEHKKEKEQLNSHRLHERYLFQLQSKRHDITLQELELLNFITHKTRKAMEELASSSHGTWKISKHPYYQINAILQIPLS